MTFINDQMRKTMINQVQLANLPDLHPRTYEVERRLIRVWIALQMGLHNPEQFDTGPERRKPRQSTKHRAAPERAKAWWDRMTPDERTQFMLSLANHDS